MSTSPPVSTEPLLSILSFPDHVTELGDLESVMEALPFAELEELGQGLAWGRANCEIKAVVRQRTCIVFSAETSQVHWLIRPSDIVFH